jgi:DNA-binding MarR family transcriptional regulator
MEKKDNGSEFVGPFTAIFENPIAKVLDQSLIVGNMEQTVSMLAESTNLSFKTVQTVIRKLESLGFIRETRKIGNARAYIFDVTNDLHELVQCAQNLQIKRLQTEINE